MKMLYVLVVLFVLATAAMITIELFAVWRSLLPVQDILDQFPFFLWNRTIDQQGLIWAITGAPSSFVAEFIVAGILRCALNE